MIRALLLALFIAGNLAFAAVQFGWLPWHGVVPAAAREPARLTQQLQPEKIVLAQGNVSGGAAVASGASAASAANASGTHAASTMLASSPAAVTAMTPATTAAPATNTAAGIAGMPTATAITSTSASAVSAAAASISPDAGAASHALAAARPAVVASGASAGLAATAAAAPVCLDIGPFAANEAAQVKGLLLAALPTGQGELQALPIDKRYWIHLQPVTNKAAADKQVAQLRAAGVTEYFLVNDEPSSNIVVSLGLFNDRERASRLMAIAQKKGLTPQLSERANARSRIVYRVAGLNAGVGTQVQNLAVQHWSARLVHACPAPVGSPPAAGGR